MKAIEHLYRLLQKENKLLTTKEIAQIAGLSRSAVSGYLAKLFKQNLVEKHGTRPVYWIVKAESSVFDQIIGSDGSLKYHVRALTQAILYPPHGLPVIITGASGTGKSLLAKLMYQRALELDEIQKNGRFVTLNTADYANNPELLSSVLFGYKKGAFTGADEDTIGLLDKANNGYLFLDEVHRLSKSDQEKLFSLLDNCTFYPLGEVSHPHKVNVRLIFATTENLDNCLLKTFLRRIPLHINLPKFIDRPLTERVAIVAQCFKHEATETKKKFSVSKTLLMDLANRNYLGNIGTLGNKVKILCSKGYTMYPNAQIIQIGSAADSGFAIIDSDFNWSEVTELTDYVFERFQNIQNELIASFSKGSSISDCKLIILRSLRSLSRIANSIPTQLFGRNIKQAIKSVLGDKYGLRLNLHQNEFELFVLAFNLSFIQEKPLAHSKELVKLFEQNYPRSFYIYRQFLNYFKPKNYANFYLWFILLFSDLINPIEEIRYTCILLAHGESTATSIQKIVNNLAKSYVFEAFDMPIDATVDDINVCVQNYLQTQKAHDHGIILLFDMGSLNQMFTKIKHASNKKLLVINNLTTASALDIAIRVQRDESFSDITEKAKNYGKYIGVQYFEGLSDQDNIIISCLSGAGLSQAIKDIIEGTLSTKKQIITMDYRKLRELLDNNDSSFFKNTQLIITTTDFKIKLDIPIINIYNILDQKWFNELKTYLLDSGEESKNVDNLLEKFLKFLTIQGIKERLQFLNPNTVIDEVQAVAAKYQKYYGVTFSGKIKLNLYMHLSLMIERILLSENKDKNNQIFFKNDIEKEFALISNTIFKPIEMKYNIKINNFEISLIFELLEDYL
ncbi:PRD domain-containing protein [Lactobacillus panisapium]|uniref:sigma 54-interacting transcriptional regulator n=3 Tax=Lactobacillus TaxID=1578 RepID=UPI001C6A6E54|nr:sigma 54-interacting transcriptional regulator [Lactobacillus panisapium]QYN54024.1 PRD domain-containing protein [Lactobacillus panisapium]